MPSFTIIAPTMSRPEFVWRLLRYHDLQRNDGEIIIADSSRPDILEKNEESVRHFVARGLNVRHVTFPKPTTLLHKLRHAADLAQSDFISLTADDDFMSVEFLRYGAEFLEKNPDFGAVGGAHVSIWLDRPGPTGRIAGLDYQPGVAPLNEPEPLRRLLRYESPPAVNLWELLRKKKDLLEILDCSIDAIEDGVEKNDKKFSLPNGESYVYEFDFDRSFLFDLIMAHLTILRGKIHNVPHLMLGRNIHMDATNAGTMGARDRDCIDLFSSPEWIRMFERYGDLAGGLLSGSLGMPAEEVRSALFAFAWRRFSFVLTQKVGGRLSNYFEPEEMYPARSWLVRQARRMPAFVRTLRRLRSRLADQGGREEAAMPESVKKEIDVVRAVVEPEPQR